MMKDDMKTVANFDRAAAGFSLACIVHCVALPALAVAAPLLGSVAEAEWVHWSFIVLAVASSMAVIARNKSARNAAFLLPVTLGIGLIVGALFAENFEFEETLPTVLGGTLLASAHIYRLFKPS